MTLRTGLAAAIIVIAVALIIRYGAQPARSTAPAASASQPSAANVPRQAAAR
jgi:hypothetical protein